MMRGIQNEFDKHPIRVPVRVDAPASPPGIPVGTTTIYQGPVIHGSADGAQIVWGSNNTVQQNQTRTESVAPGFEAIALAVVSLLRQLPAAGLPDEDLRDAKAAAEEVLAEVTQPEPDRGKIRRAVSAVKGFLAPIAMGVASGSAQGATEWARTAIEQLGTPF